MNNPSVSRTVAATIGVAALAAAVYLLPTRWPGSHKCPVENPRIAIRAGTSALQVELAANNGARYCGLAFRDQLAAGTGMLFVYPAQQRLEFWMKDTRIPLALAFIDADRRITEIHQLTPEMGERGVISKKPALFALETDPDWFDANAVSAGDSLDFALPEDLLIE